MRNLLSVPAALAACLTLGGWIHGAPAKFEGKNWHEALATIPCTNLTPLNGNIQVRGMVVVDGNSYSSPLITNPGEVNMIEKRCFGKK